MRFSCSLVLVTVASIHSQTPDRVTSEPPATVIRTNTRVVQVSVVVQDKNGQPVNGLTKDDFTLLDKGEPQNIALFAQEGGSRSAPRPTVLAPNVFTNRLDAKAQIPGNVTVVLLDTLNTPIEDQIYARKQMVNFLGQIQPQDHVAVYALTTRLYVLHDFTQDMGELIAAVERYKGQSSAQLDASGKPRTDLGNDRPAIAVTPGTDPGGAGPGTGSIQQVVQIMQNLFDNSQQKQRDMAVINRAEITTSAIEAIANHLAPIPGRKNLVWISGSFPLSIGQEGPSRKDPTRDVRDFERELERTARALNQANLAIYPVDARSLMASVNYDAADPVNYNPRQDQGYKPERETSDFVSMDLLAERTGGRSFHNNNDLTASVRRALADSEVTYQLAFYPSHAKWDGKYHDLKVQVNRPGVQLHYRKGYFATAEPENVEAERKVEIAGVVDSPLDATNLSIVVRLSPPEKGAPKVAGLAMTLDVRDIAFADTPQGKNCQLSFLFLQRDDSGKQMAGEEKHAEFNPPQQKYEAFLQTGMQITNHLTLADKVTVLKIVVRDERSGAMGSVTFPLNVK